MLLDRRPNAAPRRWLLKQGEQKPASAALKSPAEREQGGGGGRLLVCAACGRPITSSGARIAVSGKHEHVCLNPHGIVYHIGCFETASGCLAQGAPSAEWSWFPGHSWQVVICAGCLEHLGWLFRGPEGTFFGFILRRLEEREEQGA
jgi:hypothetical protein